MVQGSDRNWLLEICATIVGVLFPLAYILMFDLTVYWDETPRDLLLPAKALTLVCAALVATVGLYALGIRQELLRLPRSIGVSLGLLLGWILIATAWAELTPFALGFVGSPSRFDGSYMYLSSATILLFICAAVRRRPQLFEWIVTAIAIGAAANGLAGIGQSIDIDVWGLIGIQGLAGTPPGAFSGHSGLVAILSSMAAAMMLRLLLTKSTVRSSIVPLVLLGLNAFSAGAMGGRAAYISLGVAVAVSFASVSLFGSRPRRVASLIGHLTVIACVVLGASSIELGRRSVSDLGQAVIGADVSFDNRLVMWRIATRILRDEPIRPRGVTAFGDLVWSDSTERERDKLFREYLDSDDPGRYGPIDQVGSVISFLDTKTGIRHFVITNTDKAHNFVLDFAMAYGLPGAALLIVLFTATMLTILRTKSVWATCVVFGTLVFAVFSMAWFPTLAVDPIVWLALGAGLGIAQAQAPQRGAKHGPSESVA